MKTASNTPLVSIILSYYNQTRYIGEAIQSAVSQTYSNIEVLVVDDGSSLEAHQHLLGITDVRVIRKENGGVSSARNRGIEESHGEYVVFLDHDDHLLPTAVASHMDALKGNPQAGLVFAALRDIDENGKVVSAPYVCSPRRNYFRSFLEVNPIHCPAVAMISRRALDTVGGFDSKVEPGDDYDLYIRIARMFPVIRHSGVVAEYRIHSGAVSTDGKKMYDATVRVLDKVKSTMRLTPKEQRQLKAGYGRAATYFQGGIGVKQQMRLIYYRLRSLSQSSFLSLLSGQ